MMLLKRFEQPDERRDFPKGTFELVHLDNMTVGRARYEPGWCWSRDVGAATGDSWCDVEHVGMVLRGRAMVKMSDGREFEMKPGDLFSIRGEHDSWVIGEEPYESIHLVGAGDYARREGPEARR